MAARLGAFLAFALVLNVLLQAGWRRNLERVRSKHCHRWIPPLPPFPSHLRREGLRRCWSLWEVKSTHADPPREVKCRFRKKNRKKHQLCQYLFLFHTIRAIFEVEGAFGKKHSNVL